jgi:hypothetical protein
MKALRKALLGGVAAASLSVSYIGLCTADVAGYQEHGPAWTHTASSCTVNPSQLEKVALTGADLSFEPLSFSRLIATTQFGPVWEPLIARCNVLNPLDALPADLDPPNPQWNALIVGYADPDGMGINTNVIARLMRVRRNDGAVKNVVAFDSNKNSGTTRDEQLACFNELLDFRHNEYFVQLELIRTPLAGQRNPVIFSVRLVEVPCTPAR